MQSVTYDLFMILSYLMIVGLNALDIRVLLLPPPERLRVLNDARYDYTSSIIQKKILCTKRTFPQEEVRIDSIALTLDIS